MAKVLFDELIHKLPPARATEDFYAGGCPLQQKIVVLDDDPTGVQTVHDVVVCTIWDVDTLAEALTDKGAMFFILTNSRGLSSRDSEALHTEIVKNLAEASRRTGVSFTIISRSDSTLRGHWPLETRTLKNCLEKEGFPKIDGEVIAPFFPEGGRYTIDDVHYVKEGEWLVPAGETEFAKDTTFGYTSSDLKDWVREKDCDMPSNERIHSVSIDMIRNNGEDAVYELLTQVENFERIVVNSADYSDMEVFVKALWRAMADGKRFMFRTAAGLVRVIGAIDQKPLLTGEMLNNGSPLGGLVIVGSHVKKTTAQLNMLLTLDSVSPLEFDVHQLDEGEADDYVHGFAKSVRDTLVSGKTAVVYTTRTVVRKTEANSEENLAFSLRVSGALVKIVQLLDVEPSFIVAKGGITSSDIGVKGLGAKKAYVLGQALPGIPVWRLGDESKYPGVCYVVFPGNVGGEDALMRVVDAAQKKTK